MRKVAVVGTGTMGKLHLEAWSKFNDCEITAIIGRNESRTLQLAEQYGVKGFTNLGDALELVEADIVDVCVPTHLHKEVVLTAAKAGKSIICEKPLASSTNEALLISEECKKHNVPLFVGHVLRFSPEYMEARKQIEKGAIGNPGIMKLSRVGPYPLGRDDWYDDESKSGGVVLDLGIHDFDWLRSVFGEVRRVMAKRIKRERLEYALITLRFHSGVIANVSLAWGMKSFTSSFELAGSEGMITYTSSHHEPVKVELFEEREKNQEKVSVPSYLIVRSPLENQLHHFLDCIQNKSESNVSVCDAIKAIEIAEAALESMKTNKPYELIKGEVMK